MSAALSSLLWPMLAHIGLIVALYAWLTFARAAAVGRGEVAYAAFEFANAEPLCVAETVAVPATVPEVSVAVYVPSPLFVAAPTLPRPVVKAIVLPSGAKTGLNEKLFACVPSAAVVTRVTASLARSFTKISTALRGA